MHSNGPWTLFHWKKYISKLQTHQFAGSSKIFRLRFLQGCIFTTCIQHDSPSQGIVLSHQEIVKHHANRPAVALPTSTRQTATKSGAQNESKRVYKKRNHWEVSSIYIYIILIHLEKIKIEKLGVGHMRILWSTSHVWPVYKLRQFAMLLFHILKMKWTS